MPASAFLSKAQRNGNWNKLLGPECQEKLRTALRRTYAPVPSNRSMMLPYASQQIATLFRKHDRLQPLCNKLFTLSHLIHDAVLFNIEIGLFSNGQPQSGLQRGPSRARDAWRAAKHGLFKAWRVSSASHIKREGCPTTLKPLGVKLAKDSKTRVSSDLDDSLFLSLSLSFSLVLCPNWPGLLSAKKIKTRPDKTLDGVEGCDDQEAP